MAIILKDDTLLSGGFQFMDKGIKQYHIQYGEGRNQINLTVTLSVRNMDSESSIEVRSVDYHDETGKLVRNYLQEPRELGPLGAQGISFIGRGKVIDEHGSALTPAAQPDEK